MSSETTPAEAPASKSQEDVEEEDDYMTMSIPEPSKPIEKETYTARRIRKQREAEAKQPKSKAALAAEAVAAREAALSTAMPQTSKGFQMLAKMGFQAGSALGAKERIDVRLEPIGVAMKEDRGGIGLDGERKRKLREETEGEAKRVKAEEGDFRERVAREREAERLERLVGAAMRVAERMDEEDATIPAGEGTKNGVAAELAPELAEKVGLPPEADIKTRTAAKVPTRQINVLWRGLTTQREQKERDRRMRHDLMQSLSRNASYNDATDQDQERLAFGQEEEEVEEEDPELEEFNALEPAERLRRLVEHLRERYHYCFWCKYRYEDDKMEGCPGLTEEDHD